MGSGFFSVIFFLLYFENSRSKESFKKSYGRISVAAMPAQNPNLLVLVVIP